MVVEPKSKRLALLPYILMFGSPVFAAGIVAGLVVANAPLSSVPDWLIKVSGWTTAGLATCGSSLGAAMIPATRWQRAILTVGFAIFGVGAYMAALGGLTIAAMILFEPL